MATWRRWQYQKYTEPVGAARAVPGSQYESQWHYGYTDPQTNFVGRLKAVAGVALVASGLFAPVLTSTQEPGNSYESTYHQPWSEPVRLDQQAIRRAYQQQFLAWDPQFINLSGNATALVSGIDAAVFPDNTFQYQAVAFVVPVANVVTTVDKWFANWSEPLVKSKPRDAYFEFITSGYPATTEPGSRYESPWHQPWSEPVRFKPRATEFQALAPVPFVEDASIEAKWHFPWSEPVRRKPFQETGGVNYPLVVTPPAPPGNATGLVGGVDAVIFPDSTFQYQGIAYTPFTPAAEVITVDKWFQDFSKPSVLAKLRTADYPAFTYGPIPIVNTADQWWQDLSVPPKGKPRTVEYPYLAYCPTPIVQTVDRWWNDLSTPPKGKPRSAEYPYLAFVGPTETITVDKWLRFLEDPVRLKPWRIGENPDLFFDTFPFVKVDWFNGLAEPVRLKPGLSATQQQFLAFDPAVFVKIDWYEWLTEPVRIKPGLLVTQQLPFTAGFVPIIPSLTNWYRPLNEPVRFRTLPPHLQQAVAFTALTNLVNVVRFSRGYIIA